MANTIPQIDLEQFLSEDKSARDSFVQSLGSAFSDIGFVALRGHFLTTDLIEELYRQIKIFCHRSFCLFRPYIKKSHNTLQCNWNIMIFFYFQI